MDKKNLVEGQKEFDEMGIDLNNWIKKPKIILENLSIDKLTYFAAPGSVARVLASAQTWLVLQVVSAVGLYSSVGVVDGLCLPCTLAPPQASEAAEPCASALSRLSKSGSLNRPVPCQIHH